jgi:hypothetical protein
MAWIRQRKVLLVGVMVGILVSMAAANVHAFPLCLAALGNLLFCSCYVG